MPISPINRAKTIAVPLNAGTGSDIVTIYESSGLAVGSELMPGYTVVSYNVFVKNLKAFSQIDSLPEISLPDFDVDDSETTKLYKTLNVEWGSARKQLNLFIGVNSSWSQVGSTSILNPSGYPFRVYTLLDLFTDNLYFELGEDGKIGVQIQDVGHGLLTGSDLVVIHGSYVEEIFLESPEQPIVVNIGGSFPGTPTPTPTGEDEMSDWLIKTEEYTASVGDKIVADATNSDVIIITPSSPTIGSAIKIFGIIIPGSGLYAVVDFNGSKFNGETLPSVGLSSSGVVYDFIYHSASKGWISDMPLAPA